MATYNTPLITNQGLSLLKAEIAGNDSVTFTKIVFSSDDYSQTTDSSVQALTALSSLDLTATARSFTDVNGNLKIRGVANNQNTTSAFYIKTYGLYGKNNAGTEMLIAVSTAQNANFVPAYNGKQTNQIAYTFNIAVSSTQNITLSSSTDVDVTQADLAGINNAVNSNASSLTAQQSSYASSLSSAFSSNTSSMNSAFSANSSNASSYVSSASSSLQSQVSSYAGSIASNSSAISSNASLISALQSDALQMFGVVPTSDLASISKDGIYSLGGNSYADAPYSPIYGTITQVGTSYAVKTQIIISNLGEYYYRVVNSWGIEGWYRLASKDDISSLSTSLSSSLASMASQTNNISTSVSANSNAIANNVTNISNIQSKVNVNSTDISANATSIANLQLSAASNASAISSNATSTSSAISSVSSSNNAVSSSIASTVSVNQSNIANNSSAISNLQSSVASNSSAISSNANNIGSLTAQTKTFNDNFPQYQGTDNNDLINMNNYTSFINGWYQEYNNPGNISGFSGYGILIKNIDKQFPPYSYSNGNIFKGPITYGVTNITLQLIDTKNNLAFTNAAYSPDGTNFTWTGWKRIANTSDINQLTTTITGLTNQVNTLQSNSLQFMGTITGNSLTAITVTGIYNLGGNNFTDWINGSQLWGQLIVFTSGGVTNLTVRNSFGNMWIQSVNSWGSSGWKQVK